MGSRSIGGIGIWAMAAAALVGVACGGEPVDGESGGGGGGAPPSGGPTYYADVAPIVLTRCAGCHSDQTSFTPFALTTYDHAKSLSGAIADATKERRMPPWGAHDSEACAPPQPWKDDLRLTDAEIATLEAWDAAGAPMGDPADMPAGLAAPDPYFELPDADLELTPRGAYVASGDRDIFRCFVLDIDNDEDVFMNAVQVVPGNPEVVHHAVLFVDALGESEALAEADGGFDCFGGAGVAAAATLDVWVPGSPPRQFPANVGTRLPAGSKLVMQIHYHPRGAPAAPDLTTVQIRKSPEPPEFELFTVLFGNAGTAPELQPGPNDGGAPAFHVPPGVAGHTEEMLLPTQMDEGAQVPILGVFTHMHYVGTDMSVILQHADGTSDCLLRTPQWDFNWQRFYTYDAPLTELPRARFGDVIDLRCVYDNSMANPFVQRALEEAGLDAPIDVFLGEETLDEMCIGGVQAVLPRLQ